MNRTGATGPLRLEFALSRGEFRLEAAVTVEPGEILGVIGPNGAGKSSLLGAIAGAHRLTRGVIHLADRELARTDLARAVHLTRGERRIAHLDQRSRLFPHLSARENVAFGPRSRGASRATARAHADIWLERVGLAGRGSSRSHQFSGGEQQRIALARSLAAAPDAVLLDEPFAALDIESTVAIRALVLTELRALGVPVVLVTHDPVDLLALADRVAVIERGQIRQVGTVEEVFSAPATPFSAHFTGRVLLEGVAAGPHAMLLVDAPMERLVGRGNLTGIGTPAHATYDPSALQVVPITDPPHRSTLNVSRGQSDAGWYHWIDRIAHLTPSPSGLAVSGERWPRFTAHVSLAQAAADHLRVGMLGEFHLDAREVRLTAPAAGGPAPVPCT